MSSSRWRRLDLAGARPGEAERNAAAAADEFIPDAAAEAPQPPRFDHPAVREAYAYYRVQHFERSLDILRAVLSEGPTPLGARRVLGLSLARTGRLREALSELEAAVQAEPEDSLLAAEFLSVQLAAGLRAPLAHLPKRGPGAELGAAARWAHGQALLNDGMAREAARLFSEAAAMFRVHSPKERLSERLAACYIGEVISLLVDGDVDGAQRAFTRLGAGQALPASALTFARDVYQMAEEARDLTPAERREALKPLGAVVAEIRLRVAIYDGLQPVSIRWEDAP